MKFARAVTATVTAEFWNTIASREETAPPLRLPPTPTAEIADARLAMYGRGAADLPRMRAFFEIGELYTALLPEEHRTKHGVFYTPPSLVEHLLDSLEAEGVNWKTARVLDPACGGAAFAAFVAERMLAANAGLPAEVRLRDLKERLVGIELDPFAAWLAEVFLDIVCLPLVEASDRRIEGMVRTGDALLQPESELGSFDVVVGNPPYGKIKLADDLRRRFQRSLFGHANIYGVFTDLAVRHARPNGLIGFVTPTSFLGGEYFKNLRRVLAEEAPLVRATFVADREGVFADVLQETMLAVFRRRKRLSKRTVTRAAGNVAVEVMEPHKMAATGVQPLGDIKLLGRISEPWILPRDSRQTKLVRTLAKMPARLADYGYRVATGQLVWNRHKSQFRDRPESGCYPVLWAECIKPDGSFEFRADSRNHRPYLRLEPGQEFLVNYEPCVLVQRTTSKEQERRLIATIVPNDFVASSPGFVVENHVNMVVPTRMDQKISLRLLASLLNSQVLDRAYRCISGSVAVSAYELESLPLPDPDHLLRKLREDRVKPGSMRFGEFVEEIFHRGG